MYSGRKNRRLKTAARKVETDMLLYIVSSSAIILFLLLMGAFFAAAETAYTGISRISVRQMIKEDAWNALNVYKIKSKLDLLISTVLIGTNFVNTLNSAVVTAFALKVFGAEYVSSAASVVLVLIIVFAEIVPKTYANEHQKRTAQLAAIPILFLQKIFFPVIWIFFQFTKGIDFVEKKLIKASRPVVTEEELKTLIYVGEKEGTLECDERKMLERIFEFSDLTVRNIMRHRSLVRYINCTETFETVIAAFEESGYSRLPVYENDSENIIGVLHFKSVLFADRTVSQSKDFIKLCMQPVLFVPETLSAEELLKKFKEKNDKFAVAVNEYGGMSGIVTLDNILHEVFGRMTDEHGTMEVSPEERITLVSVNEFLVPGDMRLDDLNNVLYLKLSSEHYDTLGGWLLEKFDELPETGSVYKDGRILFIVEDQSARRIQTVRIKL